MCPENYFLSDCAQGHLLSEDFPNPFLPSPPTQAALVICVAGSAETLHLLPTNKFAILHRTYLFTFGLFQIDSKSLQMKLTE